MRPQFFIATSLLVLGACTDAAKPPELVPFPEVMAGPATLLRLTASQYRNSLHDLYGSELVLPSAIEPDSASGGLLAVGASETSISAWGVEQYESAAYAIAGQLLGDPTRRAQLVPCTPSALVDDECARRFITEQGQRIWRRPLIEDEIASLLMVADDGATTLGDFYQGLELVLAGLLQSPNFLFRAEIGENGRYGGYELASRLSYFLWSSTPDAELLSAAADGRLESDEGLAEQARRMIADPRARQGVRSFYSDMFELYRLDALNKDPTVFVHFSTDLGKLAREQTLRDLEQIIFEEDGDYRDIFTRERSFVNRRLAAIYEVRAPSHDDYGEVKLERADGRRGLLGQVSVLALRSHPSASSAVLRGAFVRRTLLCHVVPPPPVGLNTALPQPSATARTLRERDVVHLESAACAGCHNQMDPVGLGLENFDGIGRWRNLDNEAAIDASGVLDGAPFADAWELAEVVRNHPDVPRCLVRSMYRYATGTQEVAGEQRLLEVLTERFSASGHKVKSLLFDIATSPGFRQVEAPAS